MERRGKGEGEGELKIRMRDRSLRERAGPSSPFYRGPAILLLQGSYGKEHTWLLSGYCEGGV